LWYADLYADGSVFGVCGRWAPGEIRTRARASLTADGGQIGTSSGERQVGSACFWAHYFSAVAPWRISPRYFLARQQICRAWPTRALSGRSATEIRQAEQFRLEPVAVAITGKGVEAMGRQSFRLSGLRCFATIILSGVWQVLLDMRCIGGRGANVRGLLNGAMRCLRTAALVGMRSRALFRNVALGALVLVSS